MKLIKNILLILGLIATAIGITTLYMHWPGQNNMLIGPTLIFSSILIGMLEDYINDIDVKQRLKLYILFILGSVIIPFLMTPLFILIFDSRENGMGWGFAIPFLSLNLIFAFFIIKDSYIIKLLLGILVTILSLGLMFIILNSGILDSESDMYGIKSAIITYFFFSITTWEFTYKAHNKIKKNAC